MKRKTAINTLLILQLLTLLLHILALLQVVNFGSLWGGRLKNEQDMFAFESLSLLVVLFFILIILMKGDYIYPILSQKVLNVFLWFFFLIVCLTSVGFLLSTSIFEKFLSLIPLLSCFMILRIVIKQRK